MGARWVSHYRHTETSRPAMRLPPELVATLRVGHAYVITADYVNGEWVYAVTEPIGTDPIPTDHFQQWWDR